MTENGVRYLAEKLDPERGVYVPTTQIARIELLAGGADDAGTMSA